MGQDEFLRQMREDSREGPEAFTEELRQELQSAIPAASPEDPIKWYPLASGVTACPHVMRLRDDECKCYEDLKSRSD